MLAGPAQPSSSLVPPRPSPYLASGWRRNGHLQTLYSGTIIKPPRLRYIRERIPLDDGDFLDLDWYGTGERALVLMLHGLAGSSQSTYMLRTAHTLSQRGITCCCMNLRGCSGEPNRLVRSYHSGQIEDLQYIVDYLRIEYPDRPLVLAGFSLGGNLLLRWLGERPEPHNLLGAITISATMDLKATLARLSRLPSRLYQRHLTRLLLKATQDKAKRRGSGLSPQGFRGITGFAEFDDVYTAPLNGFVNAEEYYRWASGRDTLRHIEIPTWIVNARDDPFMSASGLPDEHEVSPAVETLFSPHGGHVAFLEQRADTGVERWSPGYERIIATYVCGLIEARS